MLILGSTGRPAGWCFPLRRWQTPLSPAMARICSVFRPLISSRCSNRCRRRSLFMTRRAISSLRTPPRPSCVASPTPPRCGQPTSMIGSAGSSSTTKRGQPLPLSELPGRRVLAGLDAPERLIRFGQDGSSALGVGLGPADPAVGSAAGHQLVPGGDRHHRGRAAAVGGAAPQPSAGTRRAGGERRGRRRPAGPADHRRGDGHLRRPVRRVLSHAESRPTAGGTSCTRCPAPRARRSTASVTRARRRSSRPPSAARRRSGRATSRRIPATARWRPITGCRPATCR